MIDLRFGYLFPFHVRVLSFFTTFLAFAIPSVPGGIALFLASVFVLVSSEGTEVNISKGTFREYTSYMFFKSGKFSPLTSVEKIFITKGKETTKYYNAPLSMGVEEDIHYSYLKFSTGEKVQLLREPNKQRMITKLIPLSEALHTDIVDHC